METVAKVTSSSHIMILYIGTTGYSYNIQSDSPCMLAPFSFYNNELFQTLIFNMLNKDDIMFIFYNNMSYIFRTRYFKMSCVFFASNENVFCTINNCETDDFFDNVYASKTILLF